MKESNNPVGRPKGIIDKRNLKILDLVESHDADPALFLIRVMTGNDDSLALKRKAEHDDTDKPDKDGMVKIRPVIKFEDRVQAAKELMPYLYGKRKPVDSNGEDGNDILDFFKSLNDK